MKIDIQGVEYDFEPGSITNDEGMAIENQMGCTFGQWGKLWQEGSIRALTSLVWLIQHRVNPALRIGDIHFSMDDFKVVEQDEVPAGARNEVVPGEMQAGEPDPKAGDSGDSEAVSTTEESSTSDSSVTTSL
jgi:hypothetical protein